jgi:copper(I)-binding protein
MDGATMRMREVEGGLEIPANATVTLAPHGLHLMFMGVAQPFAAGEEIPIRLTFERAGVREVRLAVRER